MKKVNKAEYLRLRGWITSSNTMWWRFEQPQSTYGTSEALTIQAARDRAIEDERWAQFFAAALSQEDMGDGGVVHHADGQDFYVRRASEIADKALIAYLEKRGVDVIEETK